MNHPTFDVIVLGLGGMGSSALFHLANRGVRVLGIEQFGPAHARGSSHGKSRLVRQAYFEHEDYVPLLQRAYTLWEELEREANRKLFHKTGVAIFGAPNSPVIQGVLKSARLHHLTVEHESADQCRKRFGTTFAIPQGFECVYEANAGYLEVEECIKAHLDMAQTRGAEIRYHETVLGFETDQRGVLVKTTKGQVSAAKLIVTAGAWNPSFFANCELKVHRVPLFWFEAGTRYEQDQGFPCFAFDMPYGFYYGFPATKELGLKVAPHIPGAVVPDPGALDRKLQDQDTQGIHQFLKECLPTVDPKIRDHAICMYTMSADGHFILDHDPNREHVVMGAGFSGHGFKFSSVIGEALGDLALQGTSSLPIDFLKLDRSSLKGHP